MDGIVSIGYEGAKVVGQGRKARTRLRLAVRRRHLCSCCELIKPDAIGVCAGSSSPSAASALGLFFVALLTWRVSSCHVPNKLNI